MAKGKLIRKKKSVFKPGHKKFHRPQAAQGPEQSSSDKCYSKEKVICRLTPEMQEMVENCPVGAPVSASHPDSPMLLRPRENAEKLPEQCSQENRLLSPEKVLELFRKAHTEHMTSTCQADFVWDKSVEQKWGWSWSMGLKCSKCSYATGSFKLYHEIESKKRGRKSSTANVGLQIGLNDSMISNTSLRQIAMSANITPPSYASMQRQSNRVGDALVKMNAADMKQQRNNVRRVLELRGEPDASVAVEGDGRYNNAIWSAAGKTPYQPATQITYSLSENVTTKKKIISVYTGNKLCHQGELQRKKNPNITCPNHKGVCTMTIQPSDSIGDEARALRHVLDEVAEDLTIGILTSDGDSMVHRAVDSSVQVMRDTRHFGNSLRKQLERAPFSDKVFPGKTKADRTSLHKRFASDVAKRCNSEYKLCFNKNKGDILKIKRQLSYCIDAVIKCYGGDCSLCKKYSLVCKGSGDKFLLPKGVTMTFTNTADEALFRQCLNFRLGHKAINLNSINSNTQKSESINRTYQKTNPKLVTWSRNFPSRIHSAVHLRNHGFAASTASKMKAVGVMPSTRLLGYLQAEDRHMKQRLKQRMSIEHRQRAMQKIISKYRRYDQQKTNNKTKPDYAKEISMPKLVFKQKPVFNEHSYAKF